MGEEIRALTDLLTFNTNDRYGLDIESGLVSYEFLLNIAINAFSLALKKDTASFDPIVGENCCQIRAVMMCIIFSKDDFEMTNLIDTLNSVVKKVRKVKNTLKELDLSGVSLHSIINTNEMMVAITIQQQIVIESYLLTLVKEKHPHKSLAPFLITEYTEVTKLLSFFPVSLKFAKKIVKKAKISLSRKSVDFVLEIARNSRSLSHLHDLQTSLLIKNHLGICSLPCFYVTKLLLQFALSKKILISVKLEQLDTENEYAIHSRCHSLYRPNGSRYEYVKESMPFSGSPAIGVLIKSCRKTHELVSSKQIHSELNGFNILDVILSCAAHHRQYADESNDILVISRNDAEFLRYREMAEIEKRGINDPSGFILSHMYCEIV